MKLNNTDKNSLNNFNVSMFNIRIYIFFLNGYTQY